MKRIETSFQISTFFRASRKNIFEAWVKPEQMGKWFCPEECRNTSAEADPRVGGKYRVAMICGGRSLSAHGSYKVVIPNQKLIFTWEWENPDPAETQIKVEFITRNAGTQVTLTGERFVDPKELKLQRQGWESTLRNLRKSIESGGE